MVFVRFNVKKERPTDTLNFFLNKKLIKGGIVNL